MLRKIPEVKPRLETGCIQVGEDWPSVHIRGDNALYYASALKTILQKVNESPEDWPFMMVCLELQELLASCNQDVLLKQS